MTARGRFVARLVTMLLALAGFVTVGRPPERRASPHPRNARRRRRPRHRPPLRPQVGGDHQRRRRRASPTDELDAIEEFVRGGGGLIVARRDGAGRSTATTSTSSSPASGSRSPTAPSRTTSTTARLRAGCSPSSRTARAAAGHVDLLARVHEACFYRAGTLALDNGGRVLARSSPSASPPEAPLAAITEHGAGRVVVLADSDLFGDDCIGELDHEPLWLNLVYWAAQPAFAGAQTVLDSPARSDPRWARAQGRRRGAAPDPGARRLGRPRPRTTPPPRPSTSRRSRRRPAPGAATSPTRQDYLDALRRRPARLGRRRLRQARLHALARGVPPRARPARRDRAPRRLPDVQAERLARHLLRGADRARAVAGLARRARALRLRQPEVRPGHVRRLHRGLRLRVRGAVPRDGLHRRAPAAATSAGSSATARPSASAASAAAPPSSCGSTCRPTPPPARPRRALRATPTSSGT